LKATQQHVTENDKLENDFEVKHSTILAISWRGWGHPWRTSTRSLVLLLGEI